MTKYLLLTTLFLSACGASRPSPATASCRDTLSFAQNTKTGYTYSSKASEACGGVVSRTGYDKVSISLTTDMPAFIALSEFKITIVTSSATVEVVPFDKDSKDTTSAGTYVFEREYSGKSGELSLPWPSPDFMFTATYTQTAPADMAYPKEVTVAIKIQ